MEDEGWGMKDGDTLFDIYIEGRACLAGRSSEHELVDLHNARGAVLFQWMTSLVPNQIKIKVRDEMK